MKGDLHSARPNGGEGNSFFELKPILVPYLQALLVLPAIGYLGWLLSGDPLVVLVVAVVSYLWAGILISRRVERSLIWNDQFTSLAKAAEQKLELILFWPIKTPPLLLRVFIVGHL